jgi:hypothetical protein
LQAASDYLDSLLHPVHLVEVLPGFGEVAGVLLEHELLHALQTASNFHIQSKIKKNIKIILERKATCRLDLE